MKKQITAKDVFVGRAAKYNSYQPLPGGEEKENQSCSTCIRRQFSFPYTCNEGWPCGDRNWRDRGSTCLNWTDNPKAPVD